MALNNTEANETVFEPLDDPGFTFACHPDVPCFTRCCQDLKLHLTPYDILRLTTFLGLSSQEFITAYTYQEIDPHFGYPRLYLQMKAEDSKCPFVTIQGCQVYHDRPGSCRLYPLGRASRKSPIREDETEERFFLVKEGHCQGFSEDRYWSTREWMTNQGADPYNELNDLWLSIITRESRSLSEAEREKKLKMFYLACYQLDDFLGFVTQSRFLDMFVIDPERVSMIKNDPVELLKLSMDWLKFSLFGEQTLIIQSSRRENS